MPFGIRSRNAFCLRIFLAINREGSYDNTINPKERKDEHSPC